jgi:hypothetical protein
LTRSGRQPSRAAGVTLVETLAASALLGTLLVGILLADGRLRHQAANAERRVEACAIADELLRTWWRKPDEFPRRDEGEVDGKPAWRWRTAPLENHDATQLGGEVIRLEVITTVDGRDASLCEVEVVLPARVDPLREGRP